MVSADWRLVAEALW